MQMYSDNRIPQIPRTATAVVGTVRPLLGSSRNGQITLYHFQKYLLFWEHEYIVSRNKITYVKMLHFVCSFIIYFC
jgi:hypothetical protein